MKTLTEIKNQVASSYGMTWEQVIMDRSIFDGTVENVAKLWAKEVAMQALKDASERAELTALKKHQYSKSPRWKRVRKDEEVDLFSYQMKWQVKKSSIINTEIKV